MVKDELFNKSKKRVKEYLEQKRNELVIIKGADLK